MLFLRRLWAPSMLLLAVGMGSLVLSEAEIVVRATARHTQLPAMAFRLPLGPTAVRAAER